MARSQNKCGLFVFWKIGLIFILLTACVQAGGPLPSLSPIQINSTYTTSSTNSPFPLATVAQTLTNSPVPPISTATSTQIITRRPRPIYLPKDTLTVVEAELQLQKWMQGSQECLLPCWGGITPGETTWQDSKQILSSVVSISSIHENHTCTFGPCNFGEWWSRDTSVSKSGPLVHGFIYSQLSDVIYQIEFGTVVPVSFYRLDMLFSQYGSPAKVFLSISLEGYSINRFNLILSYPERKFIILYKWEAMINGDEVIGCQQDGGVNLFINPVEGEWTDDSIEKAVYSNIDLSYIIFKPLNETTILSIDDFYKKFNEKQGNVCIVTQRKYWGG